VKKRDFGRRKASAIAQAKDTKLTPVVATRHPPLEARAPAMIRPDRPPIAFPAMYRPMTRPREACSTSSAR
jgi:hypothetical protein